MNIEKIEALGYSSPRLLPSGEWAATKRMIYTVGLFVGITEEFWETRFCYPDRQSAERALKEWNGFGDPPGPWIKEKGRIERSNPALRTEGKG